MLGVTPYGWGLGMAKEENNDKATPPPLFFSMKSSENEVGGDVLLPA